EFTLAKQMGKNFRFQFALPPPGVAGDRHRKAALAPQPGQRLGAIVVGGADEGDIAVAVGVGPAFGWREVDGGFVGSLNLDDVACAARGVVEDVLVALDDVQVVVGDVLHVEAPARVLARAEGVVDHVADGDDAHRTQTVQSLRAYPQEFVGPEKSWFFLLRRAEEIAVETVNGRTSRDTMDNLTEERV